MALIDATQDNLFVGAVVKKFEETLHVYKVNKCFIYAGEEDAKSVEEKWKNRRKGYKWTDFMKDIKAKKVDFRGLKIEDELVKNKSSDSVKAITKSPSKKTTMIKDCCQKFLYEIKRRKEAGKSYENTVECPICNSRINPVRWDNNNTFLFSYSYRIYKFEFLTGTLSLHKIIDGNIESSNGVEVVAEEEEEEKENVA